LKGHYLQRASAACFMPFCDVFFFIVSKLLIFDNNHYLVNYEF